MATLKELNLRLASLASTKKITQAMKLISTTKLNKFQLKIRHAKKYHEALQSIWDTVLDKIQEYPDFFANNPFAHPRPVNKTKILIFTSDRGLCGSFNSNLIKEAIRLIEKKKKEGREVNLDYYGNRGQIFFNKRKYESDYHHHDVFTQNYSEEASTKMGEIYTNGFLAGDYDEFYLVYNQYNSVISQNPLVKKILPFELAGESSESSQKDSEINNSHHNNEAIQDNYIFEPNPEALLHDLMVEFINFEIYFAFLSSSSGEHAARMTSMDSATNNCTDMIDNITLLRNRVRQAAITKELIEIISGAESI